MQDAVKGNSAVDEIIERPYSKSGTYIQKWLVSHVHSFQSIMRKRMLVRRVEFYKIQ